jgi:hypothetical protein
MYKSALVMLLAWTLIWAQDPKSKVPSYGAQEGEIKGNPTKSISIPRLLSYQGRLTDSTGNPVPDGNYQLTFRLYTEETGGSPIWTENQTVQVKNGLFSVLLGSLTPIPALPEDGSLYLSLQVGDSLELSPRLRIVSAAYSFFSERSANADLLQGRDATSFAPAFLIGHSWAYETNIIQDTLFKMETTGWYIVDDGDTDQDHTLIIGTTDLIAEYTLSYGDTVIHGEAHYNSPAVITFPHYQAFQLTLARHQYIAHLILNENDAYIGCVYIKSHP